MIYITSTRFSAAVELMLALGERGVQAATVEWGKQHHAESTPDDRWVFLAPQELPPFSPLPKGEYVHIDVDATLETQIDLAIEELQWSPAAE